MVDESVAAESDGSMRAARRLELEMLSAAVPRLRMLFDCCEPGEGEGKEEPMLEMDSGRGRSLESAFGRWRVRMMDSFRLITLPSGSMDLVVGCCG